METKILKELFEWAKSLTIAVILAFLIHTFLFAVVVVSGPSMEPTLQNNERLVMNKIIYKIHAPKRGDIVIFHASEKEDYIKRVIGEPGDKVEFRNQQLYINDQPTQEPYLDRYSGKIITEDFPPVTVPDGMIFVVGDNRGNSTDSRIIGPISLNKVIGRADLAIWPLSQVRKLWN